MIPRLHLAQGLAAGVEVGLAPEVAHYLGNVLRLRSGAGLILFDGQGGEWQGELVVRGRHAGARVVVFDPVERVAARSVTLVQAVIKPQAMDWVVQKATELGVVRLIPLQARRSPRLFSGEQAETRARHWGRIAIEACEQSGRTRLPEISPITSWEGLRDLPRARYLLRERGEERVSLREVVVAAGDVVVFVGPEGGWSQDEVDWAVGELGCVSCHLGSLILRAETAAVVALAHCY